MTGEPPDVPGVQLTRLLRAWNGGDQSALEELAANVYQELHRMAASTLRHERPGHVLQPSALVNEAFVRLMSGAPVDWQNRAQFFGFAAQLMRRILVDIARAQDTAKRGNRATQLQIEEGDAASTPSFANLVDVDSALNELTKLHPRQARVVELRFFAGLDYAEIAECLAVSEDTVGRDWRVARAWLYRRMSQGAQQ